MIDKYIPKNWNDKTYKTFIKYLYKIKNDKYRDFSKINIKTNYEIIGVNVPTLKKISNYITPENYDIFLKFEPHTYEEIFLKGLILSKIKDYNKFIIYFKNYLKYIDNWAICDLIMPKLKIIKNNNEKFIPIVKKLLQEDNQFIVRVGIVIIMTFYLNEDNLEKIFNLIENIKIKKYYSNMALSWLISTAYINYPKQTLEYLKNNKLPQEIINKAIEKINDSLKISASNKQFIKKYKKTTK